MGLIAVLVLVLAMAAPLVAQDAQEQQLIAYVAGAVEKVRALKSYSIVMEQTNDQDISLKQGNQTITAKQSVSQTLDGKILQAQDKIVGSTLVMDQVVEISQPTRTSVEMTMEMILVDNKLFARFSKVSPSVAALFPKGWVDLLKDGSKIPGFNTMNKDALLQLASVQVLYPINDKTVRSIEELASQTLDGQDLRVFDLVLDPREVYNSGGSSLAGLFNESALGGANPKEMFEALFKGMDIHLKIYISKTDQYIRQIEGDVTIAAKLPIQGGITLDQTTRVMTKITDFNEPVEIKPPTLGQT
jgi:hypothetical protein